MKECKTFKITSEEELKAKKSIICKAEGTQKKQAVRIQKTPQDC